MARSAKGGRKDAEPVEDVPEPVARSGKGGRKEAEPVDEILPEVVARSGKGGRMEAEFGAASEEEHPSSFRSGKGGSNQAADAAEGMQEELKVSFKAPISIVGRIRKQLKAKARKVAEGPQFESASMRLEQLREFRDAEWVRVSFISRLYRTRLAALYHGKKLLVPRRGLRGFVVLDPSTIRQSDYHMAATEPGLDKFGRVVDFDAESIRVDLFIIASMAVNPATGCRLGPGGDLEDVEYGMLRELGVVSDSTKVATTIHAFALEDELPSECSDVPVDTVCTPERTVRVRKSAPKALGVNWERVTPRAVKSSELLQKLKERDALGHSALAAAVPERAAPMRFGKGGRRV